MAKKERTAAYKKAKASVQLIIGCTTEEDLIKEVGNLQGYLEEIASDFEEQEEGLSGKRLEKWEEDNPEDFRVHMRELADEFTGFSISEWTDGEAYDLEDVASGIADRFYEVELD